MNKPTIGHYASHQRDVTAQEDAALNAALRSSTVKVEHPEVASLRAELAECRRGAERYRTALEQIVAPFEDLNFVSGNKLLTYIHDVATAALAADGVAEDV